MSRLEAKLSAGDFVVTAEMPTIDGGGFPEIQRQLAPMKAWVDAVNATDNPAAHAHASPLAVSIALKACGVEPVMQLARPTPPPSVCRPGGGGGAWSRSCSSPAATATA